MGKLTTKEKIDLAQKQIEEDERMIEYNRKQLDVRLIKLELHQEYLEAVSKVSELKLKPTPTSSKEEHE